MVLNVIPIDKNTYHLCIDHVTHDRPDWILSFNTHIGIWDALQTTRNSDITLFSSPRFSDVVAYIEQHLEREHDTICTRKHHLNPDKKAYGQRFNRSTTLA